MLAEWIPEVGVASASAALIVPKSTAYRGERSTPTPTPPRSSDRRSPSSRALTQEERKEVFGLLYGDRFADAAPVTVHANLLDQDQCFICSPRTMYRILADQKAARDRRLKLRYPRHKKPELLATGPNQAWT